MISKEENSIKSAILKYKTITNDGVFDISQVKELKKLMEYTLIMNNKMLYNLNKVEENSGELNDSNPNDSNNLETTNLKTTTLEENECKQLENNRPNSKILIDKNSIDDILNLNNYMIKNNELLYSILYDILTKNVNSTRYYG